jgi:hypothetical protein
MNNNIDSQFHLPLSDQAFKKYQQLQQLIQHTQTSINQKDSWQYIWGNSSTYLSRMSIHPRPSSGYGAQVVPTK